ncbi:MAG: acyl carrier protein [Calothrix sp. SM1_5_4]|nr:acyl carrier protein [Calothrix sp. SM1_5_4]
MKDEQIEDVLKSFGIYISEIDENARLSGYGLDSLMTMELVLRLEAAIGRQIPDTLLLEENLISVAALRNLIGRLFTQDGSIS